MPVTMDGLKDAIAEVGSAFDPRLTWPSRERASLTMSEKIMELNIALLDAIQHGESRPDVVYDMKKLMETYQRDVVLRR